MSRIRSIHPGLFTDEAFMSLSAYARLLIIGLWTEAWDDGVFEWKPLTLKAKLFPVDAVDVPQLLGELVSAGMISRDEAHPKSPGLIRNFQRFQRPKKPNSSGMLRPECRDYVGASSTDVALDEVYAEPVPHQFPTGTEKSPQMEDGGGKRKDEEKDPPPSVPEPERARDLVDEVWEVFPRNPTSEIGKARRAIGRLKVAEQAQLLSAARRYRQWFVEDSARRGRSEDDGVSFVPHLYKWVESGAWREARALPIKGEAAAPAVPMTKLDRERDQELWLACERVMGKPAPTSGMEWWFRDEVIGKARAAA